MTATTDASTDADGVIASSMIEWGDGSISVGSVANHVYSTPGNYAINATVTDDRGASSTASTSVSVLANQAPVAKLSITPASGIAPVTITASTAGSTDIDGTIDSSTITWSDGVTFTGTTASH